MAFATPEAAGARAGLGSASTADKVSAARIRIAGATVAIWWPLSWVA